MAFAQVNTRLIAERVKEFGLTGRFLSIGRLYPNLDVTAEYLRSLCNELGFDAGILDGLADDELIDHENRFFELIGFDDAFSLDASVTEEPDFIFDMNEPILPARLHGEFDVVYNNGSLEHIFHLPNALSHMTSLCRPGGVILHSVPANNHLDHGFYQPSPCLFFDHARANTMEVIFSRMYRRAEKAPESGLEQFGPDFYDPSKEGERLLDGQIYSLFVMMRKGPDSLTGQVPLQGRYASAIGVDNSSGNDSLRMQLNESSEIIRKLVGDLEQAKQRAEQIRQTSELRIKRLQDNNTELLKQIVGMQSEK